MSQDAAHRALLQAHESKLAASGGDGPDGDARASVWAQELRDLGRLVSLQDDLYAAASREAVEIAYVNALPGLVRARQAIFWRKTALGIDIAAMSGVAVPDAQAPLTVWCRSLVEWILAEPRAGDAYEISPGALAAGKPGLAADWSEWLPQHVAHVPMPPDSAGPGDKSGKSAAPTMGVLIARGKAFGDHDLILMERAARCFEIALDRAPAPPVHVALRDKALVWLATHLRRRRSVMVACLAVALAFVPVPMVAVAPATVVPAAPFVLRAPMNGRVQSVAVKPNQAVAAGTVLVRMDDSDLRHRLAVSKAAFAEADTELRHAAQRALGDAEAKARAEILRYSAAKHSAEIAHLENQLAQTQLTAPVGGVVLMDTREDWRDRPVRIGETLLEIGDSRALALDIALPVDSAVRLRTGAPVTLYARHAPLRPVRARVAEYSHRPEAGPDGGLAYRITAAIDDTGDGSRDDLHFGYGGTARISGGTTILALYVLRRPLAWMRLWLGI